MTRGVVVLWDIDGTLITSGGFARDALVTSFRSEPGLAEEALDFSFAGMTDWSILRTAYGRAGRPWDPDEAARALERYLALLEERIVDATGYRVHAGVRELLSWLDGVPHVAQGLGTGNVERGARIKLARGDLNAHFSFGGFGCDAEARAELIRIGLERGAARLGTATSDVTCVIIGDTVRDIQAADANGALCLGTGTGGDTPDALRAAGAACVVETLADPAASRWLREIVG